MQAKKSVSKIRVRYGETDQMGVVYHGNYAQYLEIARIEWLERVGISYKEMEANGVMLPVVSLHTSFLKSALFDDILTVTATLKKTPSVKIEFDYTIHNQKGELLTEANTILVFVSKSTLRPVKCPKEVLEKIEAFTGN